MRSDILPDDRLTEITRRRLELLSAEIAGARAGSSSSRAAETSESPVDRATLVPPPPLRPGRHALRSSGPGARAAAWLQDRLPATLHGRIALGSTHLVAIAGILAVGLAVSAWWVLRADDAGTLVPVASPSTLSPVPLQSPTQQATTAGVVVVDVTGRVRRPGIATLPAGSRVVDALRAAGGVRPGVTRVSINRARILVDGEQIMVGGSSPSGAAAAAGTGEAGSTLVNLNTADESALEALPGVGPVTAQAIIAWRTENGGFRSVDQLLDVSGIGDATLSELAPLVTL